MKYTYKEIIIYSFVLFFILLLFDKFLKNKNKTRYSYEKIQCLMTNTELKYFNALKSILNGSNYILQPQVCLSSIVKRTDIHKFQSELTRIVDFAIFNKEYSIILCIEINDKSHLKKNRIERDKKVNYILKSCKIPLYTIWTNSEFSVEKIAKDLKNLGLKLDLKGVYNEY